MQKIIGLILAAFLMNMLASQAVMVMAKANDKSKKPVTSPITSADCKPGYGYGDKNHCHSGPPGKQ